MRFLEQLPEACKNSGKLLAFNEPSTIQEKFYAPSRRRKCFRNFADRNWKTLAYMLPLLLTVEKDREINC